MYHPNNYSLNDKESIRQHIKSIKSSYPKHKLKSESLSIIAKLESDSDFKTARTVLLYSSLPDEVQTDSLLLKYINSKNILLPSVIGTDLILHELNSISQLKKGPYNINESAGPLFNDYEAIDLAIIPGVAFDRQFNRLGRGKGYYDRFLPLLGCKKIGLCYSFQLLEQIPIDKHDFKIDKIIYGKDEIEKNSQT